MRGKTFITCIALLRMSLRCLRMWGLRLEAERISMTENLEYFKVFYYTARYGSLTRAANELNISQPAVSQSLKQLEKSLGVILFQRAAKGVTLTAEGQLLFSHVRKGYEQIEQGIEKLRRMQNLEIGEVHIGASDMTLQYYLLPYLEKFHEKYPQVKVVVTNAPTPETLELLKAGKIDFGVVSEPFDRLPDIDSKAVKEIEDVFVAGRRFISYKNRTMDLQELENLPVISLENNTSSRSYMDKFLGENGVELKPEFELATSDMIVQFALRSLGVGCVVRDFAESALNEGLLFELRFNKMIPKRHFCVVTDAKAIISSAAKGLLEIMDNDGDGTGRLK